MFRAPLRILLPILGPLCLLVFVLAAGRWARAHLRPQQDWSAAFASIDCVAPPGMSRSEFLDEVQYLGGSPDRLSLLDPALPRRLEDAFSRHPWVEAARVRRVRSYRQVHVELTFRKPVLLVDARDSTETDPCELRAVDRHGVLLPRSAGNSCLPLLRRDLVAVNRPEAVWHDLSVREAAVLGAFLQPHGAEVPLAQIEIEWAVAGLVLHHKGRKIVWGKPPGREGTTEAAAEVKWQRLLEVLGDTQLADDRPYDLRPLQRPASRGVYALARP
jgi:hypothetical protein